MDNKEKKENPLFNGYDNPNSEQIQSSLEELSGNYSINKELLKLVNVDLFTEGELLEAEVIDYRQATVEHPNANISECIASLSNSFLKLESVRNRFIYEFNKYLIDNSETAFLFLQFADTLPKNMLANGELNISELISYSYNPRLQKIIGNAISRAQIADQFEHRHNRQVSESRRKGGKIEQIQASDKIPFALMANLFIEEPLILISSGSPKTGQEVRTDSDSQLTLDSLLGNGLEADLIASAHNPYAGKFVQANRKSKVPHTNGSFKMAKKIDHSLDAKPPYRSNFPFDAIVLALGLSKLKDLHRSQATKLDLNKCKDLQELLDKLAEYTIHSVLSIPEKDDIIDINNESPTGPQTIIIRDVNVEIINYRGQGIKFEKPSDDSTGRISLIGFSDTQSMTERDQEGANKEFDYLYSRFYQDK